MPMSDASELLFGDKSGDEADRYGVVARPSIGRSQRNASRTFHRLNKGDLGVDRKQSRNLLPLRPTRVMREPGRQDTS